MSSYSYMFKQVVIGDTGVGKSCVVLNFLENKIRQQHEPTIGVEFGTKTVKLEDKTLKLQIWDTVFEAKLHIIKAGQENFRSITRSYYRSAAAAILIYDISKRESFDHLKQWLDEVKENSQHNIVITLVGNKTDKVNERQIKTEEGELFAKKNGLLFFETSAKTGLNIEETFKKTTEIIYKNVKNGKIDVRNERNGVRLGNELANPAEFQKKLEKGCC